MKNIKVYTDGSSSPKLKNGAGWACIIVMPNTTEIVLSGRFLEATNNQVELWACIEALSYIKENENLNHVTVEVITDSEYLQKGATEWLPRWVSNGWKSRAGEVKNRPIWEALSNIMDGMNVQFKWVRGHNGHEYNERCDKLATQACRGAEDKSSQHKRESHPKLN